MEKNNLNDLFNDLKKLYSYSDHIEENIRLNFIKDIENLRNKIEKISPLKKNVSKKNDEIDTNFLSHERSFIIVTKLLVPTVNKENIDELKHEVKIQLLYFIDGKNSFYEIYKKMEDKFKSFIDFANLMFELESKDLISFVKKEETVSRGWIKIGEILLESNIINEDDLNKALSYQNKKDNKLIGESLLEIKAINQAHLRDALKIQKWLFKVFETSSLE